MHADPGPAERTASAGEEVTFDGSASTGAIASYLWDFGDGDSDTGKTVTHTYKNEGERSGSLLVKNSSAGDIATFLVHVGAQCAAKAQIAVITQNPQPGAAVQLDGTASQGCSGAALAEFHWNFGDQTLADGNGSLATVSHTYATKGTYQIVLRVVDTNGREGTSSRTLNVGITGGKPVITCAAQLNAVTGAPATFSASGSDPGGSSLTFGWVFSDDNSTATGTSVQHTFTTGGSFTATVTATTTDSRTSDPCTTHVTVTAPANYTGNWLLNPSASNLSGNCQFGVPFPATNFAISQAGSAMTATPSGNGWPAGYPFDGGQDPPPPADVFRMSVTGPSEDKSAAGCSATSPVHSVVMMFDGGINAVGTWRKSYTFTNSPLCNCLDSVTFTAKKQ